MSAAFESAGAATPAGSSATATLTIASVVLTGANRNLAIGIGTTNNTARTYSPSRGSDTFASIGSAIHTSSSNRVNGHVFMSTNEPQTASADLTVTDTIGANDRWGFGYVATTGVDQTTRYSGLALNPDEESSGGAVDALNITSATGDLVVDFITGRTVNDVWLANASGQTKRCGWSEGTSSTDNDGAMSTKAGETTCTLDWTASISSSILVHYGWSQKAVTITVPGAPTSLTATAASGSQIDLSWTAPASDGGSAILGYEIQRESPIGGGFSTIVSDTGTTGTTYSDTGLAAGTQYNYRVRALNAIGGSTESNEDDATTNAATAPDPPTSLAAAKESPTTMLLSWVAPVDDGDSDITGYKIERESPTGGGFSTIVADTGNTEVTYRDTGLTAATEYNYKVSAINAIGTGAASTADAETTPNSADNDDLSTIGLLSWTNPSLPLPGEGSLDQQDKQHLLSLDRYPSIAEEISGGHTVGHGIFTGVLEGVL